MPKKPKNPSNKPKPDGEKSRLSSSDLRDALTSVKIKHLHKINNPEPTGDQMADYEIETLTGITKLNKRLGQLTFDKQLDPRAVGAMNQIVQNQLRILIPQPSVNVSQVNGDPEAIVSAFLNTLPSELRNAIVAFGRTQAKMEQVATTS